MARPKNFTRCSPSIPRKLIGARAFHLLPVYYALTLSDLGREGIQHSGSYRFADHIYRGMPSGRGLFGRGVDALLLAMPAARAFRMRCTEAQRVMRGALEGGNGDKAVRILAVPCGLPRDLLELVRTLRRECPRLLHRIEYHGLDIDPAVLEEARRETDENGIASAEFHRGNALSAGDYPCGPFDCIVSTGLGEFLNNDELTLFYRHVHDMLRPGGVFFTSATAREPLSAGLLQMIELIAHYRTSDQVLHSLQPQRWRQIHVVQERTGLQTFLTAVK